MRVKKLLDQLSKLLVDCGDLEVCWYEVTDGWPQVVPVERAIVEDDASFNGESFIVIEPKPAQKDEV
jgi:hypothetical protein